MTLKVAVIGAAGYVGMYVSVRANVRTAEAARAGLASGLSVAFRSGAEARLAMIGPPAAAGGGANRDRASAIGDDDAIDCPFSLASPQTLVATIDSQGVFRVATSLSEFVL